MKTMGSIPSSVMHVYLFTEQDNKSDQMRTQGKVNITQADRFQLVSSDSTKAETESFWILHPQSSLAWYPVLHRSSSHFSHLFSVGRKNAQE